MGTSNSLKSRYCAAFAFAAAVAVSVGPAIAGGSPVAIVEEVKAASVSIQPMDYLFEGDSLTLADGEEVTISYLGSCAIERIFGGEAKVTVGRDKSHVTGKGRLKRKFVECGGGGISLTRRQSDRAAGVVVRGGESGQENRPDVTVYSLHPVLKLSHPADAVTLERLDRKESRSLEVTGTRIDLAKAGVKLAPGGIYRAVAGKSTVVFKVSNTARASDRNLISRLVEL